MKMKASGEGTFTIPEKISTYIPKAQSTDEKRRQKYEQVKTVSHIRPLKTWTNQELGVSRMHKQIGEQVIRRRTRSAASSQASRLSQQL